MIYFYCTSWQFFQIIVKWRISPTTEQIMFTFSILLFHFYSHIPCGMWRIPKLKHFVLLRFLLTHPVWDVTTIHLKLLHLMMHFYSHIPCGMWLIWPFIVFIIIYFYSHIPCGMWLVNVSVDVSTFSFLLTHPVWDVTLSTFQNMHNFQISTHTSRVGCDLKLR